MSKIRPVFRDKHEQGQVDPVGRPRGCPTGGLSKPTGLGRQAYPYIVFGDGINPIMTENAKLLGELTSIADRLWDIDLTLSRLVEALSDRPK